MKKRPRKEHYPLGKVEQLRDKAIELIKAQFLSDEKIIKIVLIGSSVKNEFGKYEPPGFRGSLYSDFDFIFFVEDDYVIPQWLEREPEGKPFSRDELNCAYRARRFVDDTYDVEIFFIKKKYMNDQEIQYEGEQAGIPMTAESKHKHIVVFEKDGKK